MGNQIEAFYKEMNKATLPSLRWTEKDKKALWKLPLSQWGDYFSLKKAKKKMMNAYAKRKVVRQLPKLVPLYINAIQKGHVMTLDYLQAYGDTFLAHFVRNHFRRKYGLNSKQWQAFNEKEERLWQDVVALRKGRQEDFLKQKIMEIDKIPQEIRQKITKKVETLKIRRSLESYFHYLDGEDRRGHKMPMGITPPATSLVVLSSPPKKEEKKEKKPFPPIRIMRDDR